MGIPQAYISHQSPGRIRVRIVSRKGDAEYFEKLGAELNRLQAFDRLELNTQTGSVLIVDNQIDADDIADYARDRKLFDLRNRNHSRSPMTTQLVSRLETLNISVRRLTSGEMDLAGVLLLILLISGISQLLKGHLRMPPWYTAFWYAFGIYKLVSVIKDDDSDYS